MAASIMASTAACSPVKKEHSSASSSRRILPRACCLHLLLHGGDTPHDHLGVLGCGWLGAFLGEDRQQVLRHHRSRPRAATGAVTVICGGPATSGPNADMTACIASLWPWLRIDASSAIRATNQKALSAPRW